MKLIKGLTTGLLILLATLSQAQINYQAVVRDSDNQPSINQNIDIEVSISQGGTVIYSEEHNDVNTGELGIVNLGIGLGTNTSSDFNEIDWSLDNYEVTMTVNQQLLPSTPIHSVPIAEYAKNSRWKWNGTDTSLSFIGNSVRIGSNTDNSLPAVEIKADSPHFNGQIILYNDSLPGVAIDGSEGAGGGQINLFNSNGIPSFQMDSESPSGRSFLQLKDPSGNSTVHVFSKASYTQSSVIDMHNDDDIRTIYIQSQEALDNGSTIKMYNDAGGLTIELDADAGTTNKARIEVDGRLDVNCLQINGGCDITEPFESSVETIEPGTVVVMTENGVQSSSQAYDNRVVGVVSGANGIQKGMSLSQTELFENGIDIAIAGRVYVKTIGEVQIGDQLVSSDTSGVAQAENDIFKAFGNSIGKALSTPDENGYVLMLVNLQ